MATAVPFPAQSPPGYEWFDDEPAFDPQRHLALEAPAEIVALTDLGYTEAEVATKASRVAVTSPVRILSDEGAGIMVGVAQRLRPFARRAGERIENVVRGGCYRSRWLRDLCLSSDVTDLLSEVYGTPVAHHTMPVHLGHLNYAPTRLGEAVDKWHHDTIPLDYVMMVSDPATVAGGEFEWFRGTKSEMAELAAAGLAPPEDRITRPEFPGPGWAVVLHGDMVVHRGAPLAAPSDRITMVNAFVSLDRSIDDQSRNKDLRVVDPPEHLFTEWARHVAWRSAGRLEQLVDELPFTPDRDEVRTRLRAAVADVVQAIDEMGDDDVELDHYEK